MLGANHGVYRRSRVYKNVVHNLAYTVAKCILCVGISNPERLHNFLGCRMHAITATNLANRHKATGRVPPFELLPQLRPDGLEKVHPLKVLIAIWNSNVAAPSLASMFCKERNQNGNGQCFDPAQALELNNKIAFRARPRECVKQTPEAAKPQGTRRTTSVAPGHSGDFTLGGRGASGLPSPDPHLRAVRPNQYGWFRGSVVAKGNVSSSESPSRLIRNAIRSTVPFPFTTF